MSQFRVRELADVELEPAFALVRTHAPGVTLNRWLDYARGLEARGGVLGLFGEAGALFGLLTFREQPCLRYRQVLLVELFVVFELSSAAPGRRALCEAAEELARERECAAVMFVVGSKGYADAGSEKAQRWNAQGHFVDKVILTKELVDAAAAPALAIA